jgi:membrane protein DedA with SNARE-associated domain
MVRLEEPSLPDPLANPLPDWLSLYGHGPLFQGVLILLGTFVLEDAATILAAMDVQVQQVSLMVAIVALYVGIILGDLGLYGLGRVAVATPLARRWAPPERFANSRDWLQGHVVKVVFVSRFLPGARLPAYTACGYFQANLVQFALTAVVATLIWTTLLFGVSLHLGRYMAEHLGAWRWAGMAGFALTVVLAARLAARLQVAHP